MTYTDKDFQDHLEKEHRISPLSTYLKEIVLGGTDGIVTTFAVVAGFTGAQGIGVTETIPFIIVLLFGFANLFADATSMGLGNFLSVRADQDVYRNEKKKENYEVQHEPDLEKAETVHILASKGFTQTQAKQLTEIYSKNEEYWVEFMMKEELEMTNPEKDNLMLIALATFFSFIIFGLVPLLPYLLFPAHAYYSFYYSIGFALIALLLLGTLRWKVTSQTIIRSIGETVLLGSISAIVAYFVGTFFRI